MNDINPKELSAVAGGRPVRKKWLPYGRQWIGRDDIRAVVNVLKSDFLTTGPSVDAFEAKLAEYVGARHAVSFSNGTAALHAACYAAGIGPGDEVVTAPLTFAASANAVLFRGGMPVFADIDERTWNIDPAAVEQRITPKTKALLPVHYAGQPADLGALSALAKRHGLIVIEDAAHALGARYRGKRIGGIGDMTAFSFHPVKSITTGEGGAVTTDNPDFYERLLAFRTHGITRDPRKLERQPGGWHYEMQQLGYNYRMTDLQAALGISQLRKADRFLERRRRYAAMYDEAFAGTKELTLPCQEPFARSAWHLYAVRLNTGTLRADRGDVYEALRRENVGTNVHYLPVYLHPYYRNLGYEPGLCPRAERLYDEILTLPLFPKMSKRDVRDVIQAVNKVLQHYSCPADDKEKQP
ncbi:UDP-4-amino-4,6-dideoxy-N-acetyl-beta-L-altrosamine transaminase [Cohnella sp. GCM10020058]|uniref:UDP-4-amino-4, 6-dideoxy-N-acetyl-beta-L-altrosamine transaminase n=1 Tax=Cohnella sp. GCM10020058 TaxID=3317330 RepID=UPI00363C75DE